MMCRVSMYAQYSGFKEDYCNRSISSLYEFNGLQSFIDTLNKDFFNSSKMSWKAYYLLTDDDERSSWRWGKTMTRIW